MDRITRLSRRQCRRKPPRQGPAAAALAAAADCDLFVLVVNGAASDHSNDVAFAQAWDRWFQEHPQHEVPPALVVITGIDRPDFGGGWKTDDQDTLSASCVSRSFVPSSIR